MYRNCRCKDAQHYEARILPYLRGGGPDAGCLTPPDFDDDEGYLPNRKWTGSPWIMIPAFGIATLAGAFFGAVTVWSLYKGNDPMFEAHKADVYEQRPLNFPNSSPRSYPHWNGCHCK